MRSRMMLPQAFLLLSSLGFTALAAAVAKPPATYDTTGPNAYQGLSSVATAAIGKATGKPSTLNTRPSAAGTATGSSASPSSTRTYVHFDCGTHIGHGSDHFLDTIHGLHTGTYPNGTTYDFPDASNSSSHSSSSSPSSAGASSSGASPFGGQYNPHSTNGLGRVRRALGLTRRQTNSGSATSASQSTANSGTKPATRINVKVYIHVVTTAAHASMVTATQVKQQVAALNSAYNPNNVFFTLGGSDFTVNDQWAVGGSDSLDLAMKSALRNGTYSALNLYFQSDLAGGVLGQCTLPTNVGSNPAPSVYVRDGCNIAAGTVPGGPINGYNMGKTAVHETGHWLGLLHTFEGYSCDGNGDFVGDTPSEAQSTDGCPTNPWKNTCGNRAGVDPIHNYMDYSTDACYSRFTPGQRQRVMTLWPQYRAGK